MTGPQFPKGRPAALDRKDQRIARKAQDEAENRVVKERSGGRCEVVELRETRAAVRLETARCQRRAIHIHHMIGGWGKRARGSSILSIHKQHTCDECHRLITGHVLQRVGDKLPLWSDLYQRIT